jgi:hypothetical protein
MESSGDITELPLEDSALRKKLYSPYTPSAKTVIPAVITSLVALVISAVIGYHSQNKESSKQSTTAFLEISASKKTGYCEFYQKFVDLEKTTGQHRFSIVCHRGNSWSSSSQQRKSAQLRGSYSVLFYKSGILVYTKLKSNFSGNIKARHNDSNTFYFYEMERRDCDAMILNLSFSISTSEFSTVTMFWEYGGGRTQKMTRIRAMYAATGAGFLLNILFELRPSQWIIESVLATFLALCIVFSNFPWTWVLSFFQVPALNAEIVFAFDAALWCFLLIYFWTIFGMYKRGATAFRSAMRLRGSLCVVLWILLIVNRLSRLLDIISDYRTFLGNVCALLQWFVVGFFGIEVISAYCLSLEYGDVPMWIYTGALSTFGLLWVLKVLDLRIWKWPKEGSEFGEIFGHSLFNALALFMVDIHGRPVRFWKMKRLVSGSEDDSNDQFFSLGEKVSDTETESEDEESEMY